MARNSDGTVVKRSGPVQNGRTPIPNRIPGARVVGAGGRSSRLTPAVRRVPVARKQR